MARKADAPLHDILDAIEGIERATAGRTLAEYEADWLTKRAVERAIEIISEASRRIPADLQALRPEIPWRDVGAIGNVLRHEYQSVSSRIIWNVVKEDLPPLKVAVRFIAGRKE